VASLSIKQPFSSTLVNHLCSKQDEIVDAAAFVYEASLDPVRLPLALTSWCGHPDLVGLSQCKRRIIGIPTNKLGTHEWHRLRQAQVRSLASSIFLQP